MKHCAVTLIGLSYMFLTNIPAAFSATGFSMETMTVEGEASYGPSIENSQPLSEGDLIPPGYSISVKNGSLVDIALDPNWENIIRLTGPTTVKIRSVFPTDIRLEYGSIYSRLPSLPTHSTHEIQTPLAVAAVRGSEYLVTHTTLTEVFNFSASPVFVFGTTALGDLLGNPSLLRDNHTTSVLGIEQRPTDQHVMSADQIRQGLEIRKSIFTHSEIAKDTKVAKTQDLSTIQTQYTQALKKRLNQKLKKSGRPDNARPVDYSKLLGVDRDFNIDLNDTVDNVRKGTTTAKTTGNQSSSGGSGIGGTVGSRNGTSTGSGSGAAGAQSSGNNLSSSGGTVSPATSTGGGTFGNTGTTTGGTVSPATTGGGGTIASGGVGGGASISAPPGTQTDGVGTAGGSTNARN